MPRQAATTPDTEFTLSIDEALARYDEAGLPRTPRSVQRYCAKGHLQCRLIETSFGEKWLIEPESVDKHIAYIKEVTPTGRDMSRHVATPVASQDQGSSDDEEGATSSDNPRHDESMSTPVAARAPQKNEEAPSPTNPDLSRPVATSDDNREEVSRLVAQLQSENEFLRSQVGTKDGQITVLQETVKQIVDRDKETNILMQGFQRMFTSMLPGARERDSKSEEDSPLQ